MKLGLPLLRLDRLLIISLILVVSAAAHAEDGGPDSTVLRVSTAGSDAQFVWTLEPALTAAGLTIFNRTVSGEEYHYYCHWTKPGTEKDFWSPVNRWQGTGMLVAERTTDTTWTITTEILASPNYLSREDLGRELKRLLQGELEAAFKQTGGN